MKQRHTDATYASVKRLVRTDSFNWLISGFERVPVRRDSDPSIIIRVFAKISKLQDIISLSGVHCARSLVHRKEGLAWRIVNGLRRVVSLTAPLKPRRRLPTSELTRAQPFDWFERSVSVGHRCRVR